MISVFDYGAGNLRSVQNTLAAIGAQYTLADDAEGLASAEKIILPGVGHFGQMMRSLDAMRVRETIVNRAKSGVKSAIACPLLTILCAPSGAFPCRQCPAIDRKSVV